MDQDGSPNMPTSQSYPSPSAVAVGDGAGPFFAHQARLSPPDDLRLAPPLARAHQAMMAAASHNGTASDPALSLHASHHGHHQQHQHRHASPHLHHQQHHHAHAHPHQPANMRPPSASADRFQPAGSEIEQDPAFTGDSNTPRKRSKVSRACDECRRKKIRCDATSESGLEQCSSCKRVGTRCQFSRVPMKRGPSKGYIKELADRLHTLENSMVSTPQGDMSYASNDHVVAASPQAADVFSTPSDLPGSTRKRTYSVIDDSSNATACGSSAVGRRPSVGAWSITHDQPRHLPHPASNLPNPPQTPPAGASSGDLNSILPQRQPYSPNGMGTHPFGAHEMGRVVVDLGELNQAEMAFDWNEAVLDRYYETVHPSLPILPHSRSALRARLAHCTASLRDAFLEALSVVVPSTASAPAGSSPIEARGGDGGGRKAYDLLATFEGHSSRNMSTNLVYLQTMILMALDADRRGPTTTWRHSGPPQAVWLGAAVGMAHDLRLHAATARSRERYATSDVDSDERLGRRDWWVLVMLDRWHAASTSSPLLIPDRSVLSIPEDRAILGDVVFHLTRLSCILGHVAEVFISATNDNDSDHLMISSASKTRPLLGMILHGELERFREGVDSVMNSSAVIQLAYWHVKLLIKHIAPHPEPFELFTPVQQMANILCSLSSSGSDGAVAAAGVTPLRHHFAALAAITLTELADLPETKEGAWASIHALLQTIEQRRETVPDELPTTWDVLIRDLLINKLEATVTATTAGNSNTTTTTTAKTKKADEPKSATNQGGLQHLADLAVGERGQNSHATNNHDQDAIASSSPSSTASSSSSPPHISPSIANGTAGASVGRSVGASAGSRGGGGGGEAMDHLATYGYLTLLTRDSSMVGNGGAGSTNLATTNADIDPNIGSTGVIIG